VREGVRRKAVEVDGKHVDVICLAKLPDVERR